MKKISRIFTVLTATTMCLLSSCSKLAEAGMHTDPKEKLEICVSISGLSPAGSKVITSPDGSGNFEEGDTISLHIMPSESPSENIFRKVKLEGNKWETGLGWSDIGSSEACITAFYPARHEASEKFIHIVSADQSIEAEYIKSDLLGAVSTARRGETASLNFSHLMSRLNVRLTCDGSFSNEEMEKAEIQIRSKNSISIVRDISSPYGIRTGEVSGNEVLTSAKNIGKGYFSAIVCPQEITESWRNSGWIRINIGNRIFEYKAPEKLQSGEEFNLLESGKETNISIELKKKEESWAGKTFWTYGIQNPPLENWGYAYVTPQKTLGLKWKTGYGWYDCNKTEPNRPGKDSEMCWAATAANMIYWWLDRNKDNIEKYGHYTGPSKYADSFDCEIFEYYKSHFFNEGNDLSAALSWFFTGRFGTGTKPGGSFFEDVLGRGQTVAEITRFGDMSFSDAMKKAFKSGEATGCVIEFPNRYLHAISVWGADFGQDGEISAIYITDSNDRDLEDQWEGNIPGLDRPQTKAGIIRKQVQKKADGYYYMESSSPGFYTFKIVELYFLGTKQAEWEQYFH